MIVTEFYRTRKDGVNLYTTHSDKDMMITNDGRYYSSAIDVEGKIPDYVETDIKISEYDPMKVE